MTYMTLIEQLRAAAAVPGRCSVADLLHDAANRLTTYDRAAKGLLENDRGENWPSGIYDELQLLVDDPNLTTIPEQLEEAEKGSVPADDACVDYAVMDPDSLPSGIDLVICDNCRRLAVAFTDRDGNWVYVHTAWPNGLRRHYCKVSDDGCEVEVVMPVLPKEEPCGSM
jgi:hypothetical protein